jgi:hypothetical protein
LSRRRRVIALTAVGSALALAAAGAARATTPPAAAGKRPTADLRAYLVAVGPIATRIDGETRRARLAVEKLASTGSRDGAAAVLRKAQRRSIAAETLAAETRAPAALRGPHSALRQTASRTARAAGRLAVQVEYATAGAAAVEQARAALARAVELERHFKTELTAQLRRAGIVVPLWLKQLAAG